MLFLRDFAKIFSKSMMDNHDIHYLFIYLDLYKSGNLFK